MDFTQHNKINSCLPSAFSKRHERPNDHFPSPPAQPKFQQQFRGSACQRSAVPRSEGDVARNFMSTPYSPPTFSQHDELPMTSPAYGSSHYCEEAAATNNDQPQLDFEYYQCAPPMPFKQNQNPFNPVMESMQQFARKSSMRVTPHRNHQTVFLKHDEEGEQQQLDAICLREQKSYKSHTRIISIPNGVRVITEILNEDNDENDSNGSEGSEQQDKWKNKKIEVTVESESDGEKN